MSNLIQKTNIEDTKGNEIFPYISNVFVSGYDVLFKEKNSSNPLDELLVLSWELNC